jgi:ABC-type ATPase with predicted acetyltransferase domain
MIIYMIDQEGTRSELRTKVRDWNRALSLVSSAGYYIDGVGFERPFDEFQEAFRTRQQKIVSLFMKLNADKRVRDLEFNGSTDNVSRFRVIQDLAKLGGDTVQKRIAMKELVEDSVLSASYGGTVS